MSNDGKHHFHLKEYSILQLLCYSESDILSVMYVLGYNIAKFGSVLHTILKLKNKGNFCIAKKTLTRRFGSDARGDRKLLYFFFCPYILFISVSLGGYTKSRRSLLFGVYARGSKISHQSALEMFSLSWTPPSSPEKDNSLNHYCVSTNMACFE